MERRADACAVHRAGHRASGRVRPRVGSSDLRDHSDTASAGLLLSGRLADVEDQVQAPGAHPMASGEDRGTVLGSSTIGLAHVGQGATKVLGKDPRSGGPRR
jgi:hypothetical protein